MIQQQHLDLLLELNTDKNPHSGGALLEHLRGTHDLLHAWGNDQAVCVGGLFHSIYGTQAYHTRSASLEDRQRIRVVIGERAERLAFLFCVSNRGEFYGALDQDDAALWNSVHEETVPVTQDEFVEFMPRLPFTTEGLVAFDANVERTRALITERAYAAAKAAIKLKRRSESRPDL